MGVDQKSTHAERHIDPAHLTTGRLLEGPETLGGIPPDIADLAARLRFSLNDGRIWLDTQRVALIHLSTLAALRQELIERLGIAEARGVLARMGYASGARDAALARKLRPHHATADAFLVGPQLRLLQGAVPIEAVTLEIDIASGHFFGEFRWVDSFEVDAHQSRHAGNARTPVCWMQTGYASGYASTFMGRTIVFKEVQCRAGGAAECRIVGKPLEAWDDIDDDLRALQPERFAGRTATPVAPAPGMYDLVGISPGFMAACHLLRKVASTEATVLFLGETGVGKEIFAHTLHRISRRAGKPFVAVNCAAIPETLMESELFGVERGAFTGATHSRPGRFERADGGTLFLDEVGTLSLTAQIKLLRALQEREIERVGDTRTRKVDVRIIAATNVDLKEAVTAGTFRDDLMFRLNVFPIRIPPLRERRDDVPLLMDYFLHHFAGVHGKAITGFTEAAVDGLYAYDYPGNIRELENLIERAVILCDEGHPLDIQHFEFQHDTAPMLHVGDSGSLESKNQPPATSTLLDEVLSTGLPLEDVEGALLSEAVARTGGNLAQAARLLGLSRPQLAYRLKRQNGR